MEGYRFLGLVGNPDTAKGWSDIFVYTFSTEIIIKIVIKSLFLN